MAETMQQGRKFVRTAESMGYVMFDVSTKIPIKGEDEFIDRVLNIDKGQQALWQPLRTVWDVINDLFCAAWIDKTRTRFGKFRPYLLLYPIYGLPVCALFFMLPYIFWDTGSTFAPKIASWLILSMFNELTATIGDIARTGMMANITPNPQERLGLITKAKFLEMFGADLPKHVFTILRDVISRNKKKAAIEINMNMRTLYTSLGLSTLFIAGLMSLYFAIVSKERVYGLETVKEKPPTIRESMNALRHNRPLLMLMLGEVLDGFTLKRQMGTYIKSILNFANFGLISGIPGSPVSYFSFAYVGKLREHFSTKTLWLLGDYINSPLYVGVYLFGIIKVKNKAKISKGVTHYFMDLWPMIFAFGVQNTIDMTLWGTKKVIPNEIRNECIDYGEWRSGFRSEGMTGVLRGMPKKLTNMVGDTMTNIVLKVIGFQTGEGYTNQTAKTAKGVFAMATLIPALMSIVSLIPKLFFNISQAERERMYADLAEKRAEAASFMAMDSDQPSVVRT
ncbi:MAG: MFS transporter [Oscillospiraceae bacterium]|nr:MFS transporter [Oscillospiraceae bacterium]